MNWHDMYPNPIFVEKMNCIPSHLPLVAEKAMPYWNDDNPRVLRQVLVMVGGEFELLCQRHGFDATLIAGVALGIVPQEELGYEKIVAFTDAAGEVRKTRAAAKKESSNARIVYERMYGDKSEVGNVSIFPLATNDREERAQSDDAMIGKEPEPIPTGSPTVAHHLGDIEGERK